MATLMYPEIYCPYNFERIRKPSLGMKWPPPMASVLSLYMPAGTIHLVEVLETLLEALQS